MAQSRHFTYGCPFLPLNNQKHHLHPQRNRPTEQSLAPTHSCLILRAGSSQVSFQSRVRSQAVSQHVRDQDSQGTDCPLGPPCHHIVSSRSGTLQGLQTEAGSGWQGTETHREVSPDKQRSLPGSLLGGPAPRAELGELPGSPAKSD